jgi:Arc/MetJ-type ribon-helix-helix transcriptional regulator
MVREEFRIARSIKTSSVFENDLFSNLAGRLPARTAERENESLNLTLFELLIVRFLFIWCTLLIQRTYSIRQYIFSSISQIDKRCICMCIWCKMKQRIQVTLNPELVAEARVLMKARKFDSLSEFLEALIREAWEINEKTIAPIIVTKTRSMNPAAFNKHRVTNKARRKP